MTSSIKEQCVPIMEEQLRTHKIITFKWLSRRFNIHSTDARQLLNNFAKDKLCDEKYSITFSNFGKTENGNLMIWLNEGNSCHAFNEKLRITDSYVFSIALTSSDFNAPMIYNEDKLIYQFDQINLSSINYPTKINMKSITKSTSNLSPRKKKEVVLTECSRKNSESVIRENSNKEKNKKCNNELQSEETNSILTNGTNDKQNNLNETTVVSIKKEDCSAETAKKEVSDPNTARSERKIETNIKKEAPLKTLRLKKKRSKKKLKRIKIRWNSSSNSESSDDGSYFTFNEKLDSKPEMPRNIEISVSKEDPVISVQGKKRKRKMFEKNVTGEDGFFYTEKEVVYVSCDSGDGEDIQNENIGTSKRTKSDDTNNSNDHTSKVEVECKALAENYTKSHKAKMKQSSIVNFFKKS